MISFRSQIEKKNNPFGDDVTPDDALEYFPITPCKVSVFGDNTTLWLVSHCYFCPHMKGKPEEADLKEVKKLNSVHP
jgi:hypothetical protein